MKQFILIGALALAPLMVQAQRQVIDPEFHHLRNAEPREWSSFPEKAESASLKVTFDLAEPERFKLLTLRQQDTKQPWSVSLNGKKIGSLLRDHNHLEHGIEIPEGVLKAEGNELEISTDSKEPDDIRVGDVALHTSLFEDIPNLKALFEKRGYQLPMPLPDALLKLKCVDVDSGEPLPCRFTITDAITGALVLLSTESDDRQAVRAGVIYTLDGEATIGVDPDRLYRIYAGRGFEYSLASAEIKIPYESEVLTLKIRRDVPTPGLVACDTHLHTFEFDRHGDCTLTERLISVAGEGVELPVSTAHDKHISYAEEADRIGANRFFTPVLGCEVTTGEGHFNSFPIEPGAAPAEHKLRPWPQIFQNIYGTPGVKVCILNHGRDLHRGFKPFGPENWDLATGTFKNGRELKANGMELINSGAQQTDPLQLVRDWFALLKSGHKIAGVGSSDSHTVNFAIPGQGRTYLEAPDGDPANIDTKAAVDSFLAGRTWVSFGLLTRLDPDFKAGGVTVKVLGPGWTNAETIRIFRNGEEVRTIDIPEVDRAKPGVKYAQTFTLSALKAKPGDFLCAVATGPGITEPWWPIMPAYQPDSPDFDPFVMGISPAVWIP